MKFDQDLCKNLWYELNPRVCCAFGNVLQLTSLIFIVYFWSFSRLWSNVWLRIKDPKCLIIYNCLKQQTYWRFMLFGGFLAKIWRKMFPLLLLFKVGVKRVHCTKNTHFFQMSAPPDCGQLNFRRYTLLCFFWHKKIHQSTSRSLSCWQEISFYVQSLLLKLSLCNSGYFQKSKIEIKKKETHSMRCFWCFLNKFKRKVSVVGCTSTTLSHRQSEKFAK